MDNAFKIFRSILRALFAEQPADNDSSAVEALNAAGDQNYRTGELDDGTDPIGIYADDDR